jgi:hypothetical protein
MYLQIAKLAPRIAREQELPSEESEVELAAERRRIEALQNDLREVKTPDIFFFFMSVSQGLNEAVRIMTTAEEQALGDLNRGKFVFGFCFFC